MDKRKQADPGAGRGTPTNSPAREGAAIAPDGAPGAAASSVALVPVDDDARLDGMLPLGVPPLASRGVGRPKNARNKRSETMADYIVQRYGDPLEASASVAAMTLRELVTELRKVASDTGTKLGATVMDIARWQEDIRKDVRPYVHAKRAPVGPDGQPVEPPTFHFHSFGAPGGFPEGAKRCSVEDMVDVTPTEQNQGLSDDGEA